MLFHNHKLQYLTSHPDQLSLAIPWREVSSNSSHTNCWETCHIFVTLQSATTVKVPANWVLYTGLKAVYITAIKLQTKQILLLLLYDHACMHRQPGNKMPLAANCRRRHKNVGQFRPQCERAWDIDPCHLTSFQNRSSTNRSRINHSLQSHHHFLFLFSCCWFCE